MSKGFCNRRKKLNDQLVTYFDNISLVNLTKGILGKGTIKATVTIQHFSNPEKSKIVLRQDFLYLSVVFDTVSHDILLPKLCNCGFEDSACQLKRLTNLRNKYRKDFFSD